MRELLDLPFDQYQRYRLVADLLGPLAAARGDLRALEVGGRTGLLREFLPGARVELVDVEPSDLAGLVLGDGSRLPFQDGAFDLVAACDTLEHVPPALRDAFVTECCRVSRGWVVLAGPYDSPQVNEAEELLTEFLRGKLGIEHRYLAEHRALGLPDLERTCAVLAEHTAEVVTVGHGNLDRWQALLTASMYLEADPQLRGLARAYYRFYNDRLHASDHAGPVYRHALIARTADAPRPNVATLAREATPANALEPFQRLFEELTAFDRRRETYETEAAALRETIETLSKDLAGHRGRLAEVDGLLRAEQADRATVAALLEAERAERETLNEMLEAERDERSLLVQKLVEERAASAEVERTLREDLGEHARSLADLKRDHQTQRTEAEKQLAEHRAVLEHQQAEASALRGIAEELTHDLEERARHQAELERRLDEVNRLAVRVNQALAEEHAENDSLRAELRSRARSLLRVLAPKKSAM